MKKGLVISGGGAWGSWGGGLIQALYKNEKKEYDLFVGSSTGSLLMLLSSLKKMQELKEGYISVNQKDIFNVNPFDKKGKVNFWNAAWRLFLGKKTLGESYNLRCLIEKFFSLQEFKKTIEEEKELIACVVNINKEAKEYKSSFENNYQNFIDWVWASSCAPIFMSLVRKNGFEYTDGGMIEHAPIQKAINKGCDEIDVIFHQPFECKLSNNYKTQGIFDLLGRVNGIMHKEISKDDISLFKLKSEKKDVYLNIYYMPYRFSENPLIFEKEKMKKWWDLGYKFQKEYKKKYLLTRDNILKNG